jgi:transposase
MESILGQVRFSVKEKLLKGLRRCCDAGLRVRYLVIINLLNGRSPRMIEKILHVHNTTVYRVAQRFREQGEWGLIDHRADNGASKLDERYLATLYRVVRSSPQEHGWRRPTWTREMLIETVAQETRTRIHVATMSRALALVRARRGRPRPVVRCPWSPWAKTRRLNQIRRLVESLPCNEVAVYEDEVDIHLNPKIGLDWMGQGQQKEVVTPGQNQKRYLAGALDVRTQRLIWVEGEKKTSDLFIALLVKLWEAFPEAKVIHVILDNFRIHTSQITKWALQCAGGRMVLHFLPPYCPNENRIERVWEDLHANVTRNHRCPAMDTLMRQVRYFLYKRSRKLRKAAKCVAMQAAA